MTPEELEAVLRHPEVLGRAGVAPSARELGCWYTVRSGATIDAALAAALICWAYVEAMLDSGAWVQVGNRTDGKCGVNLERGFLDSRSYCVSTSRLLTLSHAYEATKERSDGTA